MLSMLQRALMASAGVWRVVDPFILRPNQNITQTNFTGGWEEIDEVSPNDSDWAYQNNADATATLEVGLTDLAGKPRGGITTVRYRLAKVFTNSGNTVNSGPDQTVSMHVYEGGTLRASDTPRSVTNGTWTTYSFNPDLSSVTKWNDLRLRLVNASATSITRGVGISWAELEWEPD